MIHTFLLALDLLFSLSVRSPKVETVDVLDYEVSVGAEMGVNRGVSAWIWQERESGIDYTGVDIKLAKKHGMVENTAFFANKQARGILRGGLATKFVFMKYGRLGLSNVWDHYEPVAGVVVGIRSEILTAETILYKEGFESASFRIGKKIKTSIWLRFEPTIVYEMDRQKNESFQAKIIIGKNGL